MRDSVDALLRIGAGALTQPRDKLAERALIEQWLQSPAPLVRRLAVRALHGSDMDAEEKLDWVARSGLVYSPATKPEVFRLLADTFPGASQRSRKAFVSVVEAGPDDVSRPDDARKYEQYNLLGWLVRFAPSDSNLRHRFEAMQTLHPDFGLREHPELDVGPIETRVGFSSPRSVDDLLRSTIDDPFVEWLVNYEGEGSLWGHEREGLLEVLSGAVAGDAEWSIQLAKRLRDRREWKTDLWSAMLRGWGRSLPATRSGRVLRMLRGHERLSEIADEVARFLAEWSRATSPQTSQATLREARLLVEETWEVLPSRADEHLDWEDPLTTAINLAGGKLAETVANLLSREWSGERISGIEPRFDRVVRPMLASKDVHGEAARVFYCSQLHFFLALDELWTNKRLLPLFDWGNSAQASQVWQGYLILVRLNERLIKLMMPRYLEAVSHLDSQPERWRDRFAEHFATIAIFYGAGNPLEDGWLPRFIAAAGDADRANWAGYIAHDLHGLDDGAADLLWDKWLGEYISRRVRGIPRVMSPEETSQAASWASAFSERFGAAVTLLVRLPHSRPDSLAYHWLEKRVPELLARKAVHPLDDVVRLLEWYLAGEQESFFGCHDVQGVLETLRGAGLELEEHPSLREQLLRLGCL